MKVTYNNQAGFNILPDFNMEGKLLKQYSLIDLTQGRSLDILFIKFYKSSRKCIVQVYYPSESNAQTEARLDICDHEHIALKEALSLSGFIFYESIDRGHDSARDVLVEIAKHLKLDKYYIHKAQS